jgi:NAD(P)-dependent dehydrogenase (short-subunit alcohol dehydrogenase family)
MASAGQCQSTWRPPFDAGSWRGIATVLRSEGADVVVADLQERGAQMAATQLSGAGEYGPCTRVGVTAKADMEQMAAGALNRFGRIDILAASAGIFPHIPLADLQVAGLDQIYGSETGISGLAEQFTGARDHLAAVELDAGHQLIVSHARHTVFEVKPGRLQSPQAGGDFPRHGFR